MAKILSKEDNLMELVINGTHLVDFFATWCGPCQMLLPILDQVDFVDVIKVDVDMHQELANKFGIMSVPTLILFKDGEIVKKELGFKSLDELRNMVA